MPQSRYREYYYLRKGQNCEIDEFKIILFQFNKKYIEQYKDKIQNSWDNSRDFKNN